MRLRTPLIASLVILAAMVAASLWAWLRLPADAVVAVHWSASGQVDGYMSKTRALTGPPVMAAIMIVVFPVLAFIMPRQKNVRGNPVFLAGWVGTVLICAIAQGVIILHALGSRVDPLGTIVFAAGLFFVVIGNFLGKAKPNWVAGVRTPWTLSSDYSWEKSNRLAGRITVLLGIAIVAAALIAARPVALQVMIWGTLSVAAISVAASYVYWKNDPEREPES